MSEQANTINVVNPDGDLVSLPNEQVQSAIKAGYRIPAPQEEHALKLKSENSGGLANTLKAGAYGAARGLTFGASDQIATKGFGQDPEQIKALQEGNEVASTIGNVAGAVAPLILSGGTAAPAEAGALAAAKGAGELGAEALGSGALGAAAEIAPTSLAAKAASGITEAATPFAEKAVGLAVNPETSPIAHKILSSGLASGLGSSVEGAAYGLGQSISEDALGDPDAMGEHLMSNIGYGALLGGAGGAVFRAGEAAIPGGIAKAKGALDHMASEAEPGLLAKGYAKTASFVSGKSEEEILSAWKDRALSLHSSDELLEQAKNISKDLNDQHTGVDSALKKANSGIRDSETEASLKGVSGEQVKPHFDQAITSLDDAAKVMRSEPDLYPQNIARKLELMVEGNTKRLPEDASAFDVFKGLNDLKGQLDTHIKYGAIPSAQEMEAQNLIKKIRLGIKNSLEDEGAFGEAAARQSAFNDAQAGFLRLTAGKGAAFKRDFMEPALSPGGSKYFKISPKKVSTYLKQLKTVGGDEKSELLKQYLGASKDLTDQLEKTYQAVPSAKFDSASVRSVLEKNGVNIADAAKASEYNKLLNKLGAGAHNTAYAEGGALAAAALGHPAIGAAVEGFNMLKSPGLMIQRLAKIERMTQESTRIIGAGAKSVFGAASEASGKFASTVGNLASASSDKMKSYAEVEKNLNEVNDNPTKAMDGFENATQWIYHAAPKTSGGLQASMARAHGFLGSKLPSIQKSPLTGKLNPSPAEISKFNRYFETVKNPSHVFQKIKTGMLMPEHMETLQAVYPKMLGQMQAAVTNQLTDKMNSGEAEKLPFKTKMMLSMFLGNDLVSSISQSSIAANQMHMTGEKNKDDQLVDPTAVQPTQAGMKNLSLSDRSQTAMQSIAQGDQTS